MTLDPVAAITFIAGYKALLLAVAGRAQGNRSILPVLVSARKRLVDKPALLNDALARIKAQSDRVDEHVVRAVRTLRVSHWVFLRDTKSYSIFVHPSEEVAFAVFGLTERIRAMTGTSGVVLETGVVRFAGKFVCDGLISQVAHLGPNYRKSYSRVYHLAKAQGRFHVSDEV